ncbi:hypothetical protein R5R35_002834 [Gryllus longicercus]|uniref:rRNA methyltransferase 2, mitochondrial n=1 Tax=Gryllus longicercus TaxID=2509291 RepID=A0AAN9V0U8_9ORTH
MELSGVIMNFSILSFRFARTASLFQCKVPKYFCTCSTLRKEVPKNLKGKSKSSQEWLIRQMKDPYVEKARMSNYRCRSAFKLLEMNDKYNFLAAGQCVVDCGAAPGSWTQISVEKTNSLGSRRNEAIGRVIGIDCLSIYPIEGAILLNNMDFTSKEAQEKLLGHLQGQKVDVVLSDMAPNATGLKFMDHEKIIYLAYNVLRFSVQVSVVEGTMLVKIWDGQEADVLRKDIKRYYNNVKIVKPNASRSDSSEKYILARDFKGLGT